MQTESPRRVLLAALNARYTHTNLALLYMRNSIETANAGHKVQLCECMVTDRRTDILELITGVGATPTPALVEAPAPAPELATAPDVLVLSAYIWNSNLIRQLLPDLRALLPNLVIVIGGPEVSYNAEWWLQHFPEINVLISGAGEAAMQHLAASNFTLPNGGRLLHLPNLPFAEIPFPYRQADLARLNRRYIYYESSRGCPCSCSYCISGRADQHAEFRPTEQVKQELAQIISYEQSYDGPPIIKFVDRTFNARPERAREIWAYIIELKTRAMFHCEVHPAFLQEADFEVLSQAPPGRLQFEIGVQSVVDHTLRVIGRTPGSPASSPGATLPGANAWDRMREMVARVLALNAIEVHLDMIVGLPGEDLQQVARTFNEVLSLRPHRFDIGFLKSLPGTRIQEEAQANRQVHMREAPYQVLSNAWLAPAEFALLRKVEQLVESVWNMNQLEDELRQGEQRYGTLFAFFTELTRHAQQTGYDIRTRRRDKVVAFVLSCLSSRQGP
ncbi:MAG: DUF4080 domain-containing protein [Spirochaeta sp.]|nr:DUF4080 domain-containing protein [Spirochaeta sp.]